MELWRISNYASLSGEGGRLYPGRWNSGGRPVVYLASSPAGALIEILVHLEVTEAKMPPTYTLLHVTAPTRLSLSKLDPPAGEAWKSTESRTRKLGDDWLAAQSSVLARVPSAILPETFNYLLNPLHPDASKIKIVESTKVTMDSRLVRSLSKD